MYGRYAFSIVVGIVVTLSLLFLMQVLIATGKQALSPVAPGPASDSRALPPASPAPRTA